MQATGRVVALLLALMFSFTAALLVQTQSQAHALAPAIGLVPRIAPSVVRNFLLPAAEKACGAACRARGVAAAASTASMICGWLRDECSFEWGQNPEVAPDSDLMADRYACNADATFSITPGGADQGPLFQWTGCPGGVAYQGWLAAGSSYFGRFGGNGNLDGYAYLFTDAVGLIVGPGIAPGTEHLLTTEGLKPLYFTWGSHPDLGSNSADREGTPYKRCSKDDGTDVRDMTGAPVTYQEGNPNRVPAILPRCPD